MFPASCVGESGPQLDGDSDIAVGGVNGNGRISHGVPQGNLHVLAPEDRPRRDPVVVVGPLRTEPGPNHQRPSTAATGGFVPVSEPGTG